MSGRSLSTAAGEVVEHEPKPSLLAAGKVGAGANVAEFVRTPFDVRRNVVKVWRPLPADLWSGLGADDEVGRSRARERRAVLAVGLMALTLVCAVSGVGYREMTGRGLVDFPLLGGAFPVQQSGTSTGGWYFAPGQMLAAVLWVVGPSLAGWFFVRALWVPLTTSTKTPLAVLTFARHLSGTYLYVYLMIAAGALLLPALMLFGAETTSTLRWCLWCFLFCESFFVPAVMWSRLVLSDSTGVVFGRGRYWLLSVYVLLFVVIPIMGMASENSRAG